MPLRITGVVSLALIPLLLLTADVVVGGDLLLLVPIWLLLDGDLLVIFGEVVGDRLTIDDGFEPFWDLGMLDGAEDAACFRSLISYGLKLTLSFEAVGDVVAFAGCSDTIKAGLWLPLVLKLLLPPCALLPVADVLLVCPVLVLGLVDPLFDDNESFEFRFAAPFPDFSANNLLLPGSAPICEQVCASSCSGDLPVFSCKRQFCYLNSFLLS